MEYEILILKINQGITELFIKYLQGHYAAKMLIILSSLKHTKSIIFRFGKSRPVSDVRLLPRRCSVCRRIKRSCSRPLITDMLLTKIKMIETRHQNFCLDTVLCQEVRILQ